MTRPLTPRQVEILAAFRAQPDATQAQIAESFGIGEQTLRNHLQGIYSRLGVTTLASALGKTRSSVRM